MEKKSKKLTMEDLGYGPFFESNRAKLGLDGFAVARVTTETKGAYSVKNTDGTYLAKITGKIRHNARSKEDYPAVGDWVAIEESGEGQAVIRAILPRRTVMKRKFGDRDRSGEKNEIQMIAANIDTAYVVQSVGRDYNLNRFERYFAIARDGGIEPAVILNKIDLISKEELNSKLLEIKTRLGDVSVFATSTKTGEGLAALKDNIIKGKTYCFLGSSGVGKSSLINILLGEGTIKTGDVSEYSDRGKHVTTRREMYFLPARRSLGAGGDSGGIVIDNPGVREVGLGDTLSSVDSIFDEIATLSNDCKFDDCTHTHEPGCAVLAAAKSGTLDAGKFQNYITLQKEARHNESSKLEKRNKARQFGKFVNRVKKDLRGVGFKDF
ncbi:MAG: ribosome small subunit-dependent GTPase A [Parcubacteria group bacterium]|jgi:ribosome biogenesis GTPase